MATLPAYNPVTPHLAQIPGGLRPGTMIRVKGQMNHGGNRFNIYIQTGAALRPRSDVNLQLSVRPLEHSIVRNHLENQVAGAEERYGGCSIQPGQYFDILLLAEVASYKIAINNVHYCHFNHRIPLHLVQFIFVDGDVKINSMILEGDVASAPSLPYPGGGGGNTSSVVVVSQPPKYPVGGVQVLPVPMPPPPPPYTPYPTYPQHPHNPPSHHQQPPHHHHHHHHLHRPPGPSDHQYPTFSPYTQQNMNYYPHPQYYNPYDYNNASNMHSAMADGMPGYYRTNNYIGGTTANATIMTTATNLLSQKQHEKELKKKKKKTALKVAAGMGGIGLGAFAISRALGGSGGDGDGDGDGDGGGDE